jgi:DNA-binding NarL/FixJ family response regulator
MENQVLNLFIVDDDKLIAMDLRIYLKEKFGNTLQVTTFNDGESCLKMVDKNTQIVILDYYMEGKNGMEILKSIKAINPKTEVIMFSNNEDIALAIKLFKTGANDYIVKGQGALSKLNKAVYHIITAPIRLLGKEFGLNKYISILLLTFGLMGILTFCFLKMMK